jgi:hypothetical protein
MLLLHHPAPLVGLDQGEVEHPRLLNRRHMRTGVNVTVHIVLMTHALIPLCLHKSPRTTLHSLVLFRSFLPSFSRVAPPSVILSFRSFLPSFSSSSICSPLSPFFRSSEPKIRCIPSLPESPSYFAASGRGHWLSRRHSSPPLPKRRLTLRLSHFSGSPFISLPSTNIMASSLVPQTL